MNNENNNNCVLYYIGFECIAFIPNEITTLYDQFPLVPYDSKMLLNRSSKNGDRILIFTANGDKYDLRTPNSDTVLARCTPKQCLNVLMNTLPSFLMQHQNNLIILHASVFRLDGKTVILTGKPYTGKSTITNHAVEWYDAEFVSDDMAVFNGEHFIYDAVHPMLIRSQEKPCRYVIPKLIWNTYKTGIGTTPYLIIELTRFEGLSSIQQVHGIQKTFTLLQNLWVPEKSNYSLLHKMQSMCEVYRFQVDSGEEMLFQWIQCK